MNATLPLLRTAEAAHEPAATAPSGIRFGPFPITETGAFPPPDDAGGCWIYVTLNAEIALSLPDSAALQQLIASPRARFSIDGQWLLWALHSKYPQHRLDKLAGSDLIHSLAAHCAGGQRRLLLLGSSPARNAAAVAALRRIHPALLVAGFAPPAYQAGHACEALVEEEARQCVAAWQPDYIVLGLGAAKEHRLAWRLCRGFDGRVRGLLCFGGAIDFASGAVRRAPRGWQICGLEGLYRVLQQPRRLGRLLRVMRVLPLLAGRRY